MKTILPVVLSAWAAAAACTHPAASSSSPRAAAEAQIARGQQVYGSRCARCHGDGGQGTDKAPAVVGKGALPLDPPASREFRKTHFRTALDIAEFVGPNMPPKGEKLNGDDAWAVLAFALTANGVTLSQPVGPDNAAAIVLH